MYAGFSGFFGYGSLLQHRQFVFDDLTENLKYRINELAPCVIEGLALLITHYTDTNRSIIDFWDYHMNSKSDSLEIYVGERVEDSDSILFRRINRFIIPWL